MLDDFFKEECVQMPKANIRIGELYQAYLGWCARYNEEKLHLSHVMFGRKIREKFLVIGSRNKGFKVKGITLRAS
jgi:phage/plasmid-associated DNA primase